MNRKEVAKIERPDGIVYRVYELRPKAYEATVHAPPLVEAALNDVPRTYADCMLTISLHMRAHDNAMGAIAQCLARGVIQEGKRAQAS